MSIFKEYLLGDLLRFQRGYDITKKEQADGPIPIVSSSGVHSYHSVAKVEGPGVIIGRKGTLGTVHYLKGGFWPHDTTLWVKDFKGNDPRFLYYFLQTLQLENFDTGSSNPTLNRNHVHKIKVIFPNRPVQEKIAAVLSAYDDLIENNKRRITLLENMAEEIYREWFVRFRFPGWQEAEFEKGQPIDWPLIPVSDAIEINPTERVDKGEEKPFVGMDMLSTVSMYFEAGEWRTGNSGSKFRNGDTLFPRITPCLENGKRGFVMSLQEGQVAIGSTEFIVMRGKLVSPEYTYLLCSFPPFRTHAEQSMVGASGRQRVAENCFSFFLIRVPPIEIMDRFTKLIRPMFNEVEVLNRHNSVLERTKNQLLPRLISGKLSVESLDIQFPPSMQSDDSGSADEADA